VTLADEINNIIRTILESSTWTSAGGSNPVDNFIKELRGVTTTDLDAQIKAIVEESIPKESRTPPSVTKIAPEPKLLPDIPKPLPEPKIIPEPKFPPETKIQTEPEPIPDIPKITPEPKTPPESKITETPPDISKALLSMSKEDAQGILSKVGISPQNTTNLLKMTGGAGIIGLGLGAAGRLLPPVVAVLFVTQMIPLIIKELQRPGGFMDKRVKIDAREEAFAGLERQTRQNTRIGDRQVIIQQFEGFRNFEGFASTNTSRLIRENADRVLDIGLFDRAQGVR